MDPAHAVFLHTRISYSHFADAWGELPEMEFVETPTGMIYVTARRWKNNIWVRSNDIVLPNLAQVGHIWEDGQKEIKEFSRVGITRWTTPVDNESSKIIGWRHFHPEVNSLGYGDPDMCGVDRVDFVGQDGGRSYRERQQVPGDFDAQVSQGAIAHHALEHLTQCDKGVVMLRRLLMKEIRRLEGGEDLTNSSLRSNGHIPTYTHDTVVEIPPKEGGDDAELLRRVGRGVTEIVTAGSHQESDDRLTEVRSRIKEYVEQMNAEQ